MLKKGKFLKKELSMLGVFAIATGTTLSGGFFLLPGIAASEVGPAVVVSYLLAAIPMFPAMFSIIELGTAMPRAGGIYYFLDRTLGPLFGTIGGIGTWLALILKVSFALVGIGIYLALFFPGIEIVPFAVLIAVALGVLNFFGSKKSGNFQIVLVVGLLSILAIFIFGGMPEINYSHFDGLFDSGMDSIISTAGLVYISYAGITKVASLTEEVKNPERNLTHGLILALITSVIIYGLGTSIMVGVIPIEQLMGNFTPAASAAEIIFGKTGTILISIAAILSFISVANAGTMSASRYPLAMSRDHIVPGKFRQLSKFGTPSFSIAATVVVIVIILLVLDPTKIAKLASAFQLLMFAFVCLAVIVMRESKIESYDPGYKSPFYPWMQIIGLVAPFYLIFTMGWLSTVFTISLIILGIIWFRTYAKDRVVRTGAIYHIFERLGHQRYTGLDSELRGILKEKGLRKEDPFNEIVARAVVIDLDFEAIFEKAAELAGEKLQSLIPLRAENIKNKFLEGTKIGATPVTNSVALPHFRFADIVQPELVLLRAKKGVHINVYDPISGEKEARQIVHAIFFLVSPENNPTQHLRILAQIAGRVDDDNFMRDWMNAKDAVDLKESLLYDDRYINVMLNKHNLTSQLINLKLREIKIPKACLIACIRRGDNIIVPQGDTKLMENDQLIIIGEPEGMKEFREKFKV